MAYNDSDTSKAIVGKELTDDILNVAQAIIHRWTQLRWSTVAVVQLFSGRNNRVVFLNYPITSWTHLKEIDNQNSSETTLERYNEYDLDEMTGKLDISGGSYTPYFPSEAHAMAGRFIKGFNNYEASYSYGYDSTNANYEIVKYVEASIGLLIYKNPTLLGAVNLTGGDTLTFGDDAIHKLLMNIPRGKGSGRRF